MDDANKSNEAINPQQTQQPQQNQSQAPQIDYDKIQQMLSGTLAAKEDTALKAYFKQQGLSQEEVEQAIQTFKQQKAASLPDVGEMQTQLQQAQAIAQQKEIEVKAVLEATKLGVDASTIPYLLKLANFDKVMGEDGTINEELLKNALNQVMEDVPGFRPAPKQETGFVQIGANNTQQQTTQTEQLASIFGNKK